MKVLFIQVDVTDLSEEDLEEMMDNVSQSIAYYEGDILAFDTKTVDEETGEVLDDEPPEDPSDTRH